MIKRIILIYDSDASNEKDYIDIFNNYAKKHNLKFEHLQFYDINEKEFNKDDILIFDLGGLGYLGVGNSFTLLKNATYKIKELCKKVKKIYVVSEKRILRYAFDDDELSEFLRYFEFLDISNLKIKEVKK